MEEEVAAMSATSRRCIVCGAIMPAGALFCGDCGSAAPRTQTTLEMSTLPGSLDAVGQRRFSLATLSQPVYRRAVMSSTCLVLSLVPGYFLFMRLFPSSATEVGSRSLQSASGKLLAGNIEYLHLITIMVAVAALASLYWFALLRLRRVTLMRAWLEVAGLDIALLIVGVYGLATFLSLTGIDTADGQTRPFWWGETLNAFPDLTVRAIVLALVMATASTLCASVFAPWSGLRKAGVVVAPRGREYLPVLIAGVAAVAFLLLGFPTLILRLAQAFVGSGLFDGATALGDHVGEALALIVIWMLAPMVTIIVLATRSALGGVSQALVALSTETRESSLQDASQTMPDTSAQTLPERSSARNWAASSAMRRRAGLTSIGGLLSLIGYLLPWATLSVVLVASSCSGAKVSQTQRMVPSGADLAYQSASFLTTALSLALMTAEICLLTGGLLAWRRRPTARWAGMLLGVAFVGLCIALYQAYLLASARFPIVQAVHLTFLGFGVGFWLTIAGLLLGSVGAVLLFAAVRRAV